MLHLKVLIIIYYYLELWGRKRSKRKSQTAWVFSSEAIVYGIGQLFYILVIFTEGSDHCMVGHDRTIVLELLG